jgi:hypothetical protein
MQQTLPQVQPIELVGLIGSSHLNGLVGAIDLNLAKDSNNRVTVYIWTPSIGHKTIAVKDQNLISKHFLIIKKNIPHGDNPININDIIMIKSRYGVKILDYTIRDGLFVKVIDIDGDYLIVDYYYNGMQTKKVHKDDTSMIDNGETISANTLDEFFESMDIVHHEYEKLTKMGTIKCLMQWGAVSNYYTNLYGILFINYINSGVFE